MSIEAALASLTAATEALTTVTADLLKLRTDAIETVRTAAAPKPAAAKAAAVATEQAAKAATAATVAETTTAPAAEPALDPVQKAVAAYVGAAGISAEERAARSDKIKTLLAKVGAAKVSDVPAEKAAAVIKAAETLLSQGNLLADAPAEDDLLAA